MFKLAATLLAFVAVLASLQAVMAVPAFTSPVASTTATGGKKFTVRWSDNNKSPSYSAKGWGNSTIYLAAGSENTQFKLQTLATNVAPSRHAGKYTIDKTIGPSGKYYFIRMEGSEKDSSGNAVMAFSARFTLQGMSGQFNSTVLQAAMGQEGSASGSATTGMSTARTTSTSATGAPTNLASTNRTSDAGRLSLTPLYGAGALAAFGVAALL